MFQVKNAPPPPFVHVTVLCVCVCVCLGGACSEVDPVFFLGSNPVTWSARGCVPPLNLRVLFSKGCKIAVYQFFLVLPKPLDVTVIYTIFNDDKCMYTSLAIEKLDPFDIFFATGVKSI